MRLRTGRPDIARYADLFDLPAAAPETPVSVTFLGVASLLFSDGTSSVLTDGFFSRPALLRVGLGRVAPAADRIRGTLDRLGVPRLDAVVPVHSHYDHVMDSAVVAELTGAPLLGGQSTAMVGRGHGLPGEQIRVVTDGDTVDVGAFEVTFVTSHHCPPDRFPGHIEAPLVPPVRSSAYRCGEAWSLLVGHQPSGCTTLVQGSAGFVPGALAGHAAEVVHLGVGQLGLRSASYIEAYWEETVRTVGARRVVLIHWDDFFRPLDRPLRALPYAGDDLDATMRVLTRLAAEDDVWLHFPTAWRREDPWR
jgi:L-ascorbate metabolism protein UlaG (beta-lactamase superfamily)